MREIAFVLQDNTEKEAPPKIWLRAVHIKLDTGTFLNARCLAVTAWTWIMHDDLAAAQRQTYSATAARKRTKDTGQLSFVTV
jgi:hypothetical protein